MAIVVQPEKTNLMCPLLALRNGMICTKGGYDISGCACWGKACAWFRNGSCSISTISEDLSGFLEICKEEIKTGGI